MQKIEKDFEELLRLFNKHKETVNFIGLRELIKNKKASGRKQDMTDLDILRKAGK